jgi:methylated-DNA-[protein]-cysteine S-methyltransferase
MQAARVFQYTSAMQTLNSAALFSAVVAAPFGAVGIRTSQGRVSELVYLPPRFAEQAPIDPVAERAAQQVAHYLQRADTVFDLPLAPVGTAFQQRVWGAISAIPVGDVLTYGEVARGADRTRRARSGRHAARTGFP